MSLFSIFFFTINGKIMFDYGHVRLFLFPFTTSHLIIFVWIETVLASGATDNLVIATLQYVLCLSNKTLFELNSRLHSVLNIDVLNQNDCLFMFFHFVISDMF